MTVYETELPNVGRKFELDVGDGGRVAVVIEHNGTRSLYRQPAADADATLVAELTASEARQLGAILGGAYFQPTELRNGDVPLGNARIEWFDVAADAPLAGKSVADAEIRSRTGATLLAIQRGEETLGNPAPEVTIEVGDVLVTLGTRAEQRELESLLSGE